VAAAFSNMRDRQLIDDAELLRMIYKFSGETLDVAGMLKRGKAAGPVTVQVQPPDPNAPRVIMRPSSTPAGTPARGKPISPDGAS
jgi:hypothetical protein